MACSWFEGVFGGLFPTPTNLIRSVGFFKAKNNHLGTKITDGWCLLFQGA
jgi:hypothetical protein